ncbi:MAG: hypothetical protein K2V38_11540, partial [Gemmataceae bacterium]|nr:hypothetical protein [Gemmataceae bacterium]
RDGAEVLPSEYVRDDPADVREALRAALDRADVVLVSGGTSVGPEDHVPAAVAGLGELAVHGVALKPGGPTGVGFVGGKPVFLLPGNPTACLCAYDLFAGRVVRKLGGRAWELPYRWEPLVLAERVSSVAGRTDYVRVTRVGNTAIPVSGGAASFCGTVTADGFFLVGPETEERAAGYAVGVWLYE